MHNVEGDWEMLGRVWKELWTQMKIAMLPCLIINVGHTKLIKFNSVQYLICNFRTSKFPTEGMHKLLLQFKFKPSTSTRDHA